MFRVSADSVLRFLLVRGLVFFRVFFAHNCPVVDRKYPEKMQSGNKNNLQESKTGGLTSVEWGGVDEKHFHN
jgi:hypothetical protein